MSLLSSALNMYLRFCVVFGLTAMAIVTASDAEDLSTGLSLFEQGRFDEAKAFFADHLQSHSDCPEALYYLGRLERNGAAAQGYFRSLWEKHPHHALADDALYAICQYHYAKGYYITAMKMYRDLVRLYPQSEFADDARYWTAGCHLAVEQPDSALRAYQVFIAAHPSSEWVNRGILGTGDALFSQGKYEEAVPIYERLANASSDTSLASAALYRLGQCHDRLGHASSARAQYDLLVQKYPQSLEGRLLGRQEPRSAVSPLVQGETYTVQVGAFASKENAIRLHDRLARMGYAVSLAEKKGDGGSTLHVVQIGTYESIEAAQNIADRLEKEENLRPRVFPKERK